MSKVNVAPTMAIQTRAECALPRPMSVTHRHLLSCVNTALRDTSCPPKVTRILDVGCGDGLLIKYLVESLALAHPGREIEVHGMDVHDHGVQAPGYWANTRSMLSGVFSKVDWRQRLQLISIADAWPFPDAFFDVVISNQVLEHVGDHHRFFREHRRALSDGGVGFHLFPLHHCIIEPHLKLPLVHWVADRERRKTAIAMMTRLGFGKFTGLSHERDSYAATHADYLEHEVNYHTQGGIAAAAAAAGLVPSFAQTHYYYLQKLRAMTGRPFVETYPSGGNLMGNTLAKLLRYVSSVTLGVRPSDGRLTRNVPAATRHRVDQ